MSANTEREAFEKWYSDQGQSPRAIERNGDEYKYLQASVAWGVWQARALLAQTDKDAERYRVLRDPDYQMLENDICVTDDYFNTFFEEELDVAVDALKARRDAAIAQQSGKEA